MANISEADKDKLFTKILHLLGAPVREIEITREMMETYLEVSIEDYSRYINEWLITQQWSGLQGLDMNVADLSFAFLTRSLDFERSFSYAYSKQVGLGNSGTWELKKDFVVLTAGTQTYSIPPNRELNEILWITPSMMGSGLDPLSSSLWSAEQFGWTYAGTAAGYIQPSFNSILAQQDKSIKSRVRKGDMSYRVVGGANGAKTLYLYNTPGGNFDPSNSSTFARFNANTGDVVWYWYYDTNSLGSQKCIDDNKDIIKTPADPEIDNISWSQLNAPAQTWIRQYLLAITKASLGKVRGKYSGALDVTDASVVMDYADLVSEGKEEKEALTTQLLDRLNGMTYVEIMKKKAEEAEALNQILSKIPNNIQAI